MGQLHPSGLERLLGQLICAACDLDAAKAMANNWEMKNASHTRLETASWKAAVLTSLGLRCWNSSAVLRVSANEALGCVSMDPMDTALTLSLVFLRPLLKYWTPVVMSKLEMLRT